MKRRSKRKARKHGRKKTASTRGGPAKRGWTQFDEHLRIAQRIAKKMRKKVARLAGKSRGQRRKK